VYSGSIFHFFTIAEEIYYRFSPIFMKLGEITDGDADTAINSQHFGSDLVDVLIWIRINPEIRIRILDHFLLTFRPWWSLGFLNALVMPRP